MKALKIVAIVLLSLFLVAFVISLVAPSEYRSESKVTINAPLKHTFAVFMEEDRMSEWLEGYVSMKLIEGNKLEVGSKHEMVMEIEGQRSVMIETVTGFKENEYFAFDLENDDVFMNMDISFSAKDSLTTEIVAKSVFIPKAFIVKVMMPLMDDGGARQQKNYNNLKAIVEDTPIPIKIDSTASME